LERVSADLELLGHPVRLAILDILVRRGGEVCVCDLEGGLPVKQPTVSHHLRLLREAGWIDTVRKGVWAYYFVRPGIVRAVRGRVQRVVEGLT
jgi:ArsR family transcriptional regulator